MDWSGMFGIETPILELFIRGTCMYLGLFFLSRFFLKRQSGGAGLSDILVVVLLADAAQNAMAGEYKTITEGLLLVSTILGWSFLMDWLGTKSKFFGHLVHAKPLLIVKDGKLIRMNMKKELLTTDEVMSQIRAEGVADLKDVKEARMEGDGHISVIKKTGSD
jgi:uncharacterized membrane protein YcaP (DUF421 family)